MLSRYHRNVQFTRLLKIGNRLKEFNFRKSNPLDEGIVSIDVNDERGNRIVFNMQKKENAWNIVQQQLPNWILEKENDFRQIFGEVLIRFE